MESGATTITLTGARITSSAGFVVSSVEGFLLFEGAITTPLLSFTGVSNEPLLSLAGITVRLVPVLSLESVTSLLTIASITVGPMLLIESVTIDLPTTDLDDFDGVADYEGSDVLALAGSVTATAT